MANRTDADANTIRGTNPQNLVEKITRSKIYNSMYWKEHCFALDAETVIDKCIELRAVGGTFGGSRNPSPFMCLLLKLLQIQPDQEVIREYIMQNDSKYLRLLGAFYLRLTGKADEVYRYIEPIYLDYRKARMLNAEGQYTLMHMDEVAESMIHKDFLFDIALPRLPKRVDLEVQGLLDARLSGLQDTDIAALEAEIAEERAAVAAAVNERQREADDAAADTAAPEDAYDRGRLRLKDTPAATERDRERDRDRDRDEGHARGGDHYESGGRDRDRRERRDRDRIDSEPYPSRARERDDRDGNRDRRPARDRERGYYDRTADHDDRGYDRGYEREDAGRRRDRVRERDPRDADDGRRHASAREGGSSARRGERERQRGGDHERSDRDRGRSYRDADERPSGAPSGRRERDRGDDDAEERRGKRSKRGENTMTIEETNKLRATLGLGPLK